MTQDINVLALVKGEERYIFLFDDERRSEALRTLGRFASNPELSFSWYDAAVLSQRIRQTAIEQRAQAEHAETDGRRALPRCIAAALQAAAGEGQRGASESGSEFRVQVGEPRSLLNPEPRTLNSACTPPSRNSSVS